MALREHFDETTGLLAEQPDPRVVDEVVIAEPWDVTLGEVVEVLGTGSADRERLASHLVGALEWFRHGWSADPRREIWLRGTFASTLWLEVNELDVVFHIGGAGSVGDEWVLTVLSAQPRELHPGRISVTALRHSAVGYAFDRDQEARRSRVAVRDPRTGEAHSTGWLRITEQEVNRR